MQKPAKPSADPGERLSTAREDRDRAHATHAAARGTPAELPAATELHAAERELGAREAWLGYVERTDGV